jgi:hypothetical protein
MRKKGKAYILLPLVAISINDDGSKELMFGWFNYTWTIIF